MATSGTVSQTVFTTQKVLDHGFRRCKLNPQEVTAEQLTTGLDVLYLQLSTLASKGVPLWTIDRNILPLYKGQTSVYCPIGTVDLLNCTLRTLQRISGIYTSSAGVAAQAFDGDVTTACTQIAPAGSITIEFPGTTNITQWGVLFAATATWDFAVETSGDGVTWNRIDQYLAYAAVAGTWLWVDVNEQQSTLQSGYVNQIRFMRIVALNTTVLSVYEFVPANMPSEIPMALINRDDYANLPNQSFQGRPVQFWYDKQIPQPVMHIWPAADAASQFRQLIIRTHRYIQDVGTMQQTLEIPQRWFEPVIAQLAAGLAQEIREVPAEMYDVLAPRADKAMMAAWNSESDGAPTYFRPNISPYTR